MYTFEPELNLPKPRPIRPKDLWWVQHFLGLFGLPVLFLLVSYFLFNIMVKPIHRLHEHGQFTRGKVTAFPTSRSERKKGRLEFSFEDMNGKTQSSSACVSEEEYTNLQIGSFVDVTYLPENPKVNRLQRIGDNEVHVAERDMRLLSLFFGLLCLWGAIACERDARLHAHLGREGEPVVGTITKLRTYASKGTHFFVKYAFRDPLGYAYVGENEIVRSIYHQLTEKDSITVLYDVNQPKKNLAYVALKVRIGTDPPKSTLLKLKRKRISSSQKR